MLAAKDPKHAYPIASATKLMTYYLATQRFSLDRDIVIAPYAPEALESVAGFKPGDSLPIRDVLYGLLVPSGNDAAETLALSVSGSEPDFVARMNKAADSLGLKETSYADPIGLDTADVSSARDLADLALELRTQKLFRKIVDTERITIRSGTKPVRLESSNDLLLREPFVNGVKTGTTVAAGYVLVASGAQKGTELVSVVLGSPDEASRDSASLALFDYGFSLYAKRTVVKAGERVGSVPLSSGAGKLKLAAARSLRTVARADQEVKAALDVPTAVTGPIAKGQQIGTASVELDGEEVGVIDVVAAQAVAAPLESSGDSGLPSWALAVFAGAGVVATGLGVAALVIHRRDPR